MARVNENNLNWVTQWEVVVIRVNEVPEIGRLGGRLPERKSTKKPESNDSEDGYRRESPQSA